MKIAFIIILIVVVVGGLYLLKNSNEVDIQDKGEVMDKTEDKMENKDDIDAMMMDKGATDDDMMKKIDDETMKMIMEMAYDYSGNLKDVTEGKDIRGINTGGLSSGVANANFKDSEYMLFVEFADLPDPIGTDFYEGWVVRKNPNFDVISTGKVEKINGIYTNTYSSGQDLTDHNFYVLTIEPDDGDPRPADHIVEGTLTK